MTLSLPSKAVIDTNIFISGAVFGGNPGKILQLFEDGEIKVVTSTQIELEIFSKLTNFTVGKKTIYHLKSLLEQKSIRVTRLKKISVCRDPKDNMFLALAQAGKADFLITGDKDLLVLNKFHGTKIVTPKEFLKENLKI